MHIYKNFFDEHLEYSRNSTIGLRVLHGVFRDWYKSRMGGKAPGERDLRDNMERIMNLTYNKKRPFPNYRLKVPKVEKIEHFEIVEPLESESISIEEAPIMDRTIPIEESTIVQIEEQEVCTISTQRSRPQIRVQPRRNIKKRRDWTCTICDVTLAYSSRAKHLTSKKHLKNIQ